MLDLLMAEVDGFEVVKALRGDPTTARIPILVVTAKPITAEDRGRLIGQVTIMKKDEFDGEQFMIHVRQAMAVRPLVS